MEPVESLDDLLARARQLDTNDTLALDSFQILGESFLRMTFGRDSGAVAEFNDACAGGGLAPMPSGDPEVNKILLRDFQNRRKNLIITRLEAIKNEAALSALKPPQSPQAKERSNRVFIVHGRDEEMKLSVARVVEKIQLEPVILHERPDKGRTIIEKFTDYSDVGYAIVLLSPDDMGYAVSDGQSSSMPRARQNVVLELGFFVGKLGRENVLALVRGGDRLEWPSDYSGVIHTEFDGPEGGWRTRLVKELQACGYNVDANRLTREL